jgi:hypothetical protein
MTSVPDKSKHKPLESHTLDEVLKSLQDLIRNELLDAEPKPPAPPKISHGKVGRPRKPPAPPVVTQPKPVAAGRPADIESVMRSLKALVTHELADESAAAPSHAEGDTDTAMAGIEAAWSELAGPAASPDISPDGTETKSVSAEPTITAATATAIVPLEGLQQELSFDEPEAALPGVDEIVLESPSATAPCVALPPASMQSSSSVTPDTRFEPEMSTEVSGLDEDTVEYLALEPIPEIPVPVLSGTIESTEEADTHSIEFEAVTDTIPLAHYREDESISLDDFPVEREITAPDDSLSAPEPESEPPEITTPLDALPDMEVLEGQSLPESLAEVEVDIAEAPGVAEEKSADESAPASHVELELDDIPVLEDVVMTPLTLEAEPIAATPPLPDPQQARDLAIRVVAKLNIEMRKAGGQGLDIKTILRLQALLKEALDSGKNEK